MKFDKPITPSRWQRIRSTIATELAHTKTSKLQVRPFSMTEQQYRQHIQLQKALHKQADHNPFPLLHVTGDETHTICQTMTEYTNIKYILLTNEADTAILVPHDTQDMLTQRRVQTWIHRRERGKAYYARVLRFYISSNYDEDILYTFHAGNTHMGLPLLLTCAGYTTELRKLYAPLVLDMQLPTGATQRMHLHVYTQLAQ